MSFKISTQSFKMEMEGIDFTKISYIYGFNILTSINDRNTYFKDKNYNMELTVTREFSDTTLLRWVEKVKQGKIDKKDAKLILQDGNGNPAVIFHLKGCFPIEWSIPELNSSTYYGSINIATETIILAIESLEISD